MRALAGQADPVSERSRNKVERDHSDAYIMRFQVLVLLPGKPGGQFPLLRHRARIRASSIRLETGRCHRPAPGNRVSRNNACEFLSAGVSHTKTRVFQFGFSLGGFDHFLNVGGHFGELLSSIFC